MRATIVVCFCLWLGAAVPTIAAQSRLPEPTGRAFDDFARVMPARRADQVDEHVRDSARLAGHDIRAAIVAEPEAYGYGGELNRLAADLLRLAKIGDAKNGHGALLVIAAPSKRAAVALGRGYPAEARNIADDVARNVVALPLESGDYAAAVEFGASIIAMRLEARDYSAPIEDVPAWIMIAPFAAFGVLVVVAVFFVLRAKRKRMREAALGGLGGPDAAMLLDQITDDAPVVGDGAPTSSRPSFERPHFDRPESPR